MDKFFSFMRISSKISIIGIIYIGAIITSFILADLAFSLGYGYKPSDLIICAAILLASIAIYVFLLRFISVIDRK